MKPTYPLHRPSNLTTLNKVIQLDQFNDDAKGVRSGGWCSPEYLAFIERNLIPGNTLDVGCGSGMSILSGMVTHATDANPGRVERASTRDPDVEVRLAATECLPYEPGSMANVTAMHGFFQVRSDYEALMEINRVLEIGGHFIFDLPIATRTLEFGRVIDMNTYLRGPLKEFGFETVEKRTLNDWEHVACVEKIKDFDFRDMLKLQVIRTESGLYEVNNLNEDDYRLW